MPSTLKPGHALLAFVVGGALGYYIGKKKK